MNLKGNPWKCTCANTWLAKWLLRWMRETLQLHASGIERSQAIQSLVRSVSCRVLVADTAMVKLNSEVMAVSSSSAVSSSLGEEDASSFSAAGDPTHGVDGSSSGDPAYGNDPFRGGNTGHQGMATQYPVPSAVAPGEVQRPLIEMSTLTKTCSSGRTVSTTQFSKAGPSGKRLSWPSYLAAVSLWAFLISWSL